MNKFKILNRILELYNKNTNIIDYLKRLDGNEKNCIEDILISYDFQAGTYIDSYKESIELKQKYGFKLAKEIIKCIISNPAIGIIPLNIGTPISDIGIEAKSAIIIEITNSKG